MNPIRFPQVTVTLTGTGDIKPLPTFTDGNHCISCWQGTWRERLVFLLTGRMWLWVQSGHTQPPVCLDVDDPGFRTVTAPAPEQDKVGKIDMESIVRAAVRRTWRRLKKGALHE